MELGGIVHTIKLAHFRLTHSSQFFLAAYPHETQEMVFDAHNRAFASFGGMPDRMVYDNPKTIVPGDLHRQGTPVQPPPPGPRQPLLVRAGGLYPGLGLGEGAG